MKQIKSILVASELRKESYEALAYGITLGRMFDAKVSCIHVIKPSPIDLIKETFKSGSIKYTQAIKNAKTESKQLLSRTIEMITTELGIGEVDIDLKIVSGNLSKSIISYSEEIGADLLIISTEPGTRFSKTPHTNLALNLIASQKNNVLLIPSGFRMERIDQIGAFVNYLGDDVEFINKLIKLSRKTEKGVKLIHAIQDSKKIEKAKYLQDHFEKLFSDELKEDKVTFHCEIGDLRHIVNALQLKHNIDLMIIRAYNRHWDLYTSFPDFSEKVMKNIKIPLWVLKNTNKKILIKG